MKWLVVDNGNVTGFHESGRATELPPDEGSRIYVDATDNTLIADYRTLRDQISAEGRSVSVQWDGTQLVVPPDNRPTVRITVDRAPDVNEGIIIMDSDGVDSVNFTVELLRSDGTVNTSFSGMRLLPFESVNGMDERLKLEFIAGVASRAVKARLPGNYLIRSADKFKLEASVNILAVS